VVGAPLLAGRFADAEADPQEVGAVQVVTQRTKAVVTGQPAAALLTLNMLTPSG
jgi:hypothetical protein